MKDFLPPYSTCGPYLDEKRRSTIFTTSSTPGLRSLQVSNLNEFVSLWALSYAGSVLKKIAAWSYWYFVRYCTWRYRKEEHQLEHVINLSNRSCIRESGVLPRSQVKHAPLQPISRNEQSSKAFRKLWITPWSWRTPPPFSSLYKILLESPPNKLGCGDNEH